VSSAVPVVGTAQALVEILANVAKFAASPVTLDWMHHLLVRSEEAQTKLDQAIAAQRSSSRPGPEDLTMPDTVEIIPILPEPPFWIRPFQSKLIVRAVSLGVTGVIKLLVAPASIRHPGDQSRRLAVRRGLRRAPRVRLRRVRRLVHQEAHPRRKRSLEPRAAYQAAGGPRGR
jgi:hypothetical protein